MSKWQILFRNLFPLAEGIRENVSGRKCRAAAALTVTALVFSVLDVTPAGFIGNEREALAAYRQGQGPSDKVYLIGRSPAPSRRDMNSGVLGKV